MGYDFLHLSTWWGLSNKPGSKHFYLNNDGSYKLEIRYAREINQTGNWDKAGSIDSVRMAVIKKFAHNCLSQNTNRLIFDAGTRIDHNDGNVIFKLINNEEIWNQIMELIPEFEQAPDNDNPHATMKS